MAAETITAIIGKALLTKAAHKDKLQKLVDKWKGSFQSEDGRVLELRQWQRCLYLPLLLQSQ